MTYKTNKPSKARWSGIIFAATFLAFPILQFIVFYLGVNVKSWISAFQLEKFKGGYDWSLIHFQSFFDDLKVPLSQTTVMIKNTFVTFGVYDFISLPLCVFFSYVLYKKVAASSFFRVVFYFPSLLSIVALALVFYFTVETKGPIAKVFYDLNLGYPSPFGRASSAFTWVMLFCVWSGFGYSIVLFSGSIARLPVDIFESAKIEGCSMAREFFTIVVPLLAPTISTLFILNFAAAFGMWAPVQLLTSGGNDTVTIGFYIFSQTKNSNYNYPSAVGLLVSAIVVPVVLILKAVSSKFVEEVTF